ncbi:MAG TPA: glutaredoxin [Spongiibacteraceae bacterium]|nr:glutaredoxin [Spongiibacteraceae bacterium]HCS29289.1 glutaredoxin [Spongiibacteraceae bacterium]|tara:strand:+ start:817 stop:1107 length:291 start_codon:yes stop_codon:yes gene_type:complete
MSRSDNRRAKVIVEVLTAAGCRHCRRTQALVKDAIAEINDHRLLYREINILDEIDYAVQLGLISAPGIAVNGELVFPARPSKAKLMRLIRDRLAEC